MQDNKENDVVKGGFFEEDEDITLSENELNDILSSSSISEVEEHIDTIDTVQEDNLIIISSKDLESLYLKEIENETPFEDFDVLSETSLEKEEPEVEDVDSSEFIPSKESIEEEVSVGVGVEEGIGEEGEELVVEGVGGVELVEEGKGELIESKEIEDKGVDELVLEEEVEGEKLEGEEVSVGVGVEEGIGEEGEELVVEGVEGVELGEEGKEELIESGKIGEVEGDNIEDLVIEEEIDKGVESKGLLEENLEGLQELKMEEVSNKNEYIEEKVEEEINETEQENFFKEKVVVEEKELEEVVGIGEEKSSEVKEERKPEEKTLDERYKEVNIDDIKKVLSYLDSLFGYLPEDKIKEFAKSEYYEVYNKLFDELGI